MTPETSDDQTKELLRRFLQERADLGDGFWPRVVQSSTTAEELTRPPKADADPPAPHEAPAQKPPTNPTGVVVNAEEPDLFAADTTSEWDGLTLEEFGDAISGCMKCALGKSRTKFVFGEGDPNADLMFIGEAPGEEEDRQGRPFVGRAGQLLTKMIEAMGLTREQVYIANVLKCRPPGNRNPKPEEEAQCRPYLDRQIELIKPKLICLMGLVAAKAVLHTSQSLGKMRGAWHEYQGTKVMVTYHPAALLRNPHWKRPTWEDLKALRLELDGTQL